MFIETFILSFCPGTCSWNFKTYLWPYAQKLYI